MFKCRVGRGIGLPKIPSRSFGYPTRMATPTSFNIGELEGIEWRLGVSVKSNKIENLNSPFVSFLVRVKDSNNQLKTHSFELSLAEFQHFAKKFQDMAQVMDNLTLE